MLILAFILSATIGYENLLVDPVAHRVGMGYALYGDGYSVHYNPAGLALGSGLHYSASYLRYIGATHFGFLGYERSQFGIGIRYFNSGSMKKTDEFGDEFGSFSVQFIDVTVGKGFVYKNIGLGISVKGVYAAIDTLYSIGAGIDCGAIYSISGPDIQIGFAVKNIGSGIKAFTESKELLPYEFNVSGVKRFTAGWCGVDIVKPALQDINMRIGGAYTVITHFDIKASYNTMLSSIRTGSSGQDFLAGLTVGFALYSGKMCVDYSYSPYFDLGGGHRLSVSVGG